MRLGRETAIASGALPADGDYQIAVGATRGNATFHLDVAITGPVPGDDSIRNADWDAVIAADPALAFEQVEQRFSGVS